MSFLPNVVLVKGSWRHRGIVYNDRVNRKDRKLQVFLSAPTLADVEKKELILWLRKEILKCGVEFTYDWVSDESKYEPRELYKRISDGIYQSDLVIAELTFPSTGVGQQVGMALTRKIPVLGLVASWKDVPQKFTIGAESDTFKVVHYSKENARLILSKFIKEFGKERFVKFNFISTPDLNEALELKSEKMGMSRSQLLRKIIREWLD